jgi:pyrroline-5-carboxylate reductase
MMASYYNMLDTMSVWLNKRGVKKIRCPKICNFIIFSIIKRCSHKFK